MGHNTTSAQKAVSFESSYKGSGMRPNTKYKYHLREQDDGRVLLDAQVYAGRNFTDITLENAQISRAEMDAVLKICGGFSALAKLRDVEKDPPFNKNDPRTDGPHYNEILEVIWENGDSMVKAPPNDGSKLVLLNYLQMLAIRLALPPADGNIFSFTFYGKDKWGNYHYELLERNGEITLYAVYPNKYERKTLERTTAAREDLQALQAICDKYALAGAQQTYRPSLPPNFDRDGKKYDKKHNTYIRVDWENGAILDANTTFRSEKALKSFFLELAVRLANQEGR